MASWCESYTGHVKNYIEIPLGNEATNALQTGRNVVSVHCKHSGGGQFIDLGLRQPTRGALDIAKLIRKRGKEILSAAQLKEYEQFRHDLSEIENGSRMDVGVKAMVVQESGRNRNRCMSIFAAMPTSPEFRSIPASR